MKKPLIFLLLLFITIMAPAQKVKSSCTAVDSIIAKYKSDADRLALRLVFKNATSYMDSAIIPKILSDDFLNALIAVYNADSLRVRDTVIRLLQIHTLQQPVLNSFYMAADSNLRWMRMLRKDSLPTGIDSVDKLLNKYQLSVSRYYRIGGFPYHIVILQSKRNYNMEVVTNLWDSLQNVTYANVSKVDGDGSDIKATVDPNYIELLYSYGWGNCQTGCMNKRYYKFRVYKDCSVSYLGSYGSKLIPNTVSDVMMNKIGISPNPFTDKINFKNLSTPAEYAIYNSLGQTVRHDLLSESSISNLSALPSGIYILQLKLKDSTTNYKLIKE